MKPKKRGGGVGKSQIDRHPQRPLIEKAIALKVPWTKIAERFNVSYNSVRWHAKRANDGGGKLSPALRSRLIGDRLKRSEDLDKLKTEESSNLLATVAQQRERLWIQQDQAMNDGDHAAVAQLGRVILESQKIVGTLLGELHRHTTQLNINIFASDEYIRLRRDLSVILQQHPQARRAVIEAFNALERQALEQKTIPGRATVVEEAGHAP